VTGGGLLHPFAHLDVGKHLNVAEKLLQYRFCRSLEQAADAQRALDDHYLGKLAITLN
jgi:hypothetical protein